MRCARCDSVAVPPCLGRLPDGRLVFGWCRACMTDAGCEFLDPPRRPRRTLPRLRWPRPATAAAGDDGRRLALFGVLGLMAAWGLILAFIGGMKLPAGRRFDAAASPFGNGSGALLVGGAGAMAVVSLMVWLALLGRGRRGRLLLRMTQVGSAVAAFAALFWGVLRHQPKQDPWIVGVAALAMLVSWGAGRRLRTGPPAARPVRRGRPLSSHESGL